MRVFAWIMIVIVVLCGLGLAYTMWAAALSVGPVTISVVPAEQMSTQFESLKLDGQYDAVKGLVFEEQATWGEAYEYAFHIYTATLQNRGFLPAEWVELTLSNTASPGAGLLIQETHQQPGGVSAFGQATVQLTVLARANAEPAQQVTLTYFVWGNPYSILLTAQAQP